jgi:predicted Zn-dependent protease with MMP-like domain
MTRPAPEIIAPDAELIEQLARDTVANLPAQFRASATHILVLVEEFPSLDLMEVMGIDDPYYLTGVYDGTPLTERNASDPPRHPDRIWLFRRPILDEWIDRGDVSLAELVAHVMVHELAHHFGWSDDDIAAIDPWWE